jgi:hypothetical protein
MAIQLKAIPLQCAAKGFSLRELDILWRDPIRLKRQRIFDSLTNHVDAGSLKVVSSEKSAPLSGEFSLGAPRSSSERISSDHHVYLRRNRAALRAIDSTSPRNERYASAKGDSRKDASGWWLAASLPAQNLSGRRDSLRRRISESKN